MQEIAKRPKARFEWWVQTKFSILPSDPSYRDLTDEQWELMWEHYKLDNPIQEDNEGSGTRDSEYDEAYNAVEDYNEDNPTEEGRMPLQDSEAFKDFDFDEEWNREEEEIEPIESIEENQQPDDFETKRQDGEGNENGSTESYDGFDPL